METQTENLLQLAQADLTLLLGRTLAPPSRENQAELAQAAPQLPVLLERAGVGAGAELRSAFAQLLEQIEEIPLDDWTAEYNRLFESSVACPINETGYIRRDKGAILADVAGFYKAFGLELDQDANEKVDHLLAELDFVSLLLVMLATAEQEGEAESARVVHDALGSFAFDHLGEWLPAFCDRLADITGLGLYHGISVCLRGLWEHIVAENRLPQAGEAPIVVEEDTGTPYECDMAAGSWEV